MHYWELILKWMMMKKKAVPPCAMTARLRIKTMTMVRKVMTMLLQMCYSKEINMSKTLCILLMRRITTTTFPISKLRNYLISTTQPLILTKKFMLTKILWSPEMTRIGYFVVHPNGFHGFWRTNTIPNDVWRWLSQLVVMVPMDTTLQIVLLWIKILICWMNTLIDWISMVCGKATVLQMWQVMWMNCMEVVDTMRVNSRIVTFTQVA
mmetsp:Transcript_7558/g.12706  ORF Transcript_7558/g.12706 Transcript_7558/m.12706 type:complete len:208 (+) Transcript_7558:887-1510(+)